MTLQSILELSAKEVLSDYVTAIAWSPVGNTLAAASGAGEVYLLNKGVGGGREGGAQGRGACAASAGALREVSDAWRERGFGGARAVNTPQVATAAVEARRNAAIHARLWRLGGVARVRDETQRGSR